MKSWDEKARKRATWILNMAKLREFMATDSVIKILFNKNK